MLRFRARGERASSPPAFEAAPLDIRDPSFAALAGLSGDISGSTSGQRVRDIYLNDPELQKLYPLGLLPLGQLHFLGWLTKHGRADQRLTDAEIHAFLRESAEEESRAFGLTYLLQPAWQEYFPFAVTDRGWSEFGTGSMALTGTTCAGHCPWRCQRFFKKGPPNLGGPPPPLPLKSPPFDGVKPHPRRRIPAGGFFSVVLFFFGGVFFGRSLL